MERIYSAFFTSERHRKPSELTAAALERHNATQKTQSCPVDGDRRRADVANQREESCREVKHYTAARTQEIRKITMDWMRVKKDLKVACHAAVRAFVLAYGFKAFTAVLLASRKWSSLE